jgi:hypothetical protein
MNYKRLFEGVMLWSCGVAMGGFYAGIQAYPVQEIMLTGTEPAWVDPVTTLITVALVGATLGGIGVAYETYTDNQDDE